MPRFRAAIDAKAHADRGAPSRAAAAAPAVPSTGRCWRALHDDARTPLRAPARALPRRCARSPPASRGRAPARPPRSSHARRSTGCCGCSCACCSRRTASSSSWRRPPTAENHRPGCDAAAQGAGRGAEGGGDDRIVRSLQDTLADAGAAPRQLRKAQKNASSWPSSSTASRARSRRSPRWRQPAGSRLPQQPGRLGGRQHAPDREKPSASSSTSPAWPTNSPGAADPRGRLEARGPASDDQRAEHAG